MLRDYHIKYFVSESNVLNDWLSFPSKYTYLFVMDSIVPRKYRSLFAIMVEASTNIIDAGVALFAVSVALSSLVAVKNLCNRIKSNKSGDISLRIGTRKKESEGGIRDRREDPKAVLFAYAENVYSSLATLYIGCHYGLFANMTKHRDEVIVDVNFEGDDVENEDKWTQVNFQYKPGSNMKDGIKSRLFPLFHMPRYQHIVYKACLMIFPSYRDDACNLPLIAHTHIDLTGNSGFWRYYQRFKL